ncbi:Ig-like domain repeat protein, partial [Streptomyces griseoluteus]|uniref:Ig-like domain repeat protein n=1 Tax=Streptomyces griseoluteus TaxID=29306 RepID=UPI003410B802
TDQTTGSPFAVTATYNGDGNYLPSTGTDTQTVNRASTTTTVTSLPDPTVVTQAATITAKLAPVAPGAGTPTGTVTFTFGDGTPSVTRPLSGSVATTTHAYDTTTGSPFAIVATYSGDTGFAASKGADTQTVDRAATTAKIVSSPNPSTPGGKVTVTATVTPTAPAAGTPTGTVTLVLGDRNPQVINLVDGVATATFNPINRGTYTMTASYNGDSAYASATATGTHRVT